MISLNFSDNEIREQVLDFMRSLNCYPADNNNLILDGYIHRYKLKGDKSGEYSGAYCIYADGVLPAGWVEDWHSGKAITWHYDTTTLSQEQRDYFNSDEFRKKSEAERNRREKERQAKQAEAAERSRILWEALKEAPGNHPYLKKKQVFPYGIRINSENKLAIPLRDINGNVKSIQWISPDGSKRFQPDTALEGLFWSIGLDTLKPADFDGVILLGEGFATMAKLYELTGKPCVAGISCYFMKSVAEAIMRHYPHARIIVMADNDKVTEDRRGYNPGSEPSFD